MQMAKAKLFVITGPSGAGKTTIAQEILKKDKNITKVITCTTRAMRKGEKDVCVNTKEKEDRKTTVNLLMQRSYAVDR